jgi:hypothetical protein
MRDHSWSVTRPRTAEKGLHRDGKEILENICEAKGWWFRHADGRDSTDQQESEAAKRNANIADVLQIVKETMNDDGLKAEFGEKLINELVEALTGVLTGLCGKRYS